MATLAPAYVNCHSITWQVQAVNAQMIRLVAACQGLQTATETFQAGTMIE